MDSLSQFVLGAAVGEAVLGRKIGNKAIMWGGIAGTIPDLDVIASPLMSEVDALAFHRGISHSISFSVLAAILFGWLLYKLYDRPRTNVDPPTLRLWQSMFFLAFITHILLDCFTMYGTQVFAPFSDYRLAFSTISVADPVYTLPFLLCLIITATRQKANSWRVYWNYAGIVISSMYLIFTIFNKQKVQTIFEQQLKQQEIDYKRMILGPTILNNILWSATIDADSCYYQGQYSLFDTSDIQFSRIEKNHDLLGADNYDRTLNILRWFTAGYYNVIYRQDGKLQLNDLRYGTYRSTANSENDYVFRFVLTRSQGQYEMEESRGGPEPGEGQDMIKELWERIQGI